MNNKPLSSATTWRLMILLSLLLLLASCGFQPRGEQAKPGTSISPLTISGLPVHHKFVRILTRQLEEADVIITNNRPEAATEIRIFKQKSDRYVLSVDDRQKTVEYEIWESLEYSIKRPASGLPAEKQLLTAQRIIFIPETDVLGRTQEAVMHRQDMYEELSRRLIQRISRIP